MKVILSRFIREEDGQAMVEYVIVAAILVMASYGVVKLLLAGWKAKYGELRNTRTGIAGMLP